MAEKNVPKMSKEELIKMLLNEAAQSQRCSANRLIQLLFGGFLLIATIFVGYLPTKSDAHLINAETLTLAMAGLVSGVGIFLSIIFGFLTSHQKRLDILTELLRKSNFIDS